MATDTKTLKTSKIACWLALACLVVPMFGSYFFDDMFSTVSQIFKNPEMLQLGWNSQQFGFYAGGYSFLCVWGGLIICGILLDKFGVRLIGSVFVGMMVVGAAIVTCAISSKGLTPNSSLTIAYIGCMLFGLGSEIAGVAVTRSIAKWFKGKNVALAMGLQLAIARIGTGLAMLLSPVLVLKNHVEGTMFTLSETKEYLESQKFKWDNLSIAECYMILGGIPYYLHLLDKNRSLAQNVDRLFFTESALLADEFDNLYNSLFSKSEDYVRIVETLSKKKSGFTRDEICKGAKLSNGGGLTRKLIALEQCGFIRKYKTIGEVPYLYQLSDCFTLFYFQFLKNGAYSDHETWMHLQTTNTCTTWRGLAFERLCFAHLQQIKHKLGISGILTNTCSYYSSQAQVDMVIERTDRAVTVCEMKFSERPYAITKSEWDKIEVRLNEVQRHFKRKTLFFAMITSSGIANNKYSMNYVQQEVTLEDLF